MTSAERRVIRDAFRVVERTLLKSERHLQQSIGKLDVAEREHNVEVRDELRKVNRRLANIEKTTEETSRHAKFTSASVERITRALAKAGIIGKDESDTGYSEVLGTPRRPRSR